MEYNFDEILFEATNGNKKAIEQIIKLYKPLILKYSYISGKVDEDLKQTIILKIIKSLPKFILDY